ncbi:hypothetical protein ElyMa_002711000 [Elysia marginata]|uniref:Uncharacterized protein n=1 Tax=Elysia marginata TaxID=1093978 RepID=A0AAV4HF78_9GAST|nr:hypothetical protein ElyMa_002711000 [Elysia marginata]
MFDGSTVHLETAKCHIESPFFSGNAINFALPNSIIADVIIGNINAFPELLQDVQEDPAGYMHQEPSAYRTNISSGAATRQEQASSST